VVLAGLFGLLLPELVTGAQRYLGHLDANAHTTVADAPVAGRGPGGHPAELLAVVTSPCARVSNAQSDPHNPDAPIPMQAPESGLGSVEADEEQNDVDDFASHLRVVFDGTAQLNRTVEPGMSLGGRALSRLEDDRNHKPPRS
jgi:hypothetical protein